MSIFHSTIQPMNQPSGLIFYLDYKHNISKEQMITKCIKIPWKMYKFVNNIGDIKKSVKNANVIGDAIRQWWNSTLNRDDKIKLTSINETYMVHMNLVIERLPFFNNVTYRFVDKIAILPIVTFEPRNLDDIDNNDFVFGGTMKISKTDPEEIVSVIIESVEVIPGKYQMQQ